MNPPPDQRTALPDGDGPERGKALSDSGEINLAQRHRFGGTHQEPDVPLAERSARAFGWTVAGLLAFWVGVIFVVRGCA